MKKFMLALLCGFSLIALPKLGLANASIDPMIFPGQSCNTSYPSLPLNHPSAGSAFCGCYRASAIRNCKPMGGGAICDHISFHTMIVMTASKMNAAGTLDNFCQSVQAKTGISKANCIEDNGIVFSGTNKNYQYNGTCSF